MWSKLKEGQAFVISAPSGAGKTTLMKKILADPSLNLKYSISCTTREPRKGEKHGRDYFFLSKKTFFRKIKKGDFLEHANVYGHFYGTDKKVVKKIQKQGSNVLIDVDTKGARSLQKHKGFHAVYIFILPPSLQELQKRLIKRRSEEKKEMKTRLREATKEIDQARRYDYCVVNATVSQAIQDIKAIMKAESLTISRYVWMRCRK